MKKKIPVPGATGAMGCYLVPELLSMGYAVNGVSRITPFPIIPICAIS